MGKNELLIYGIFIAVFLLVNYIMQQAARRARAQQEQEQEQEQQPEAEPFREDEALEPLWGRTTQAQVPAPVAHVEPARRVEAAVEPVPERPTRRTLFRSRQDLRHAVVVMTVLGPCRALEPHDQL